MSSSEGPVAITYALRSRMLPTIEETLPFAERARRSLIEKLASNIHSSCLTGKTPQGEALKDHRHAHYLPLDEDGDGLLDKLLLYAPSGFGPPELEAVKRLTFVESMRSSEVIELELTTPAPFLSERSNSPPASRESTGSTAGSPKEPEKRPLICSSSARWTSHTPFSLPYFPSRGAGKKPRARDLPEGQLGREFRVRGLPEPIAIQPIDGYKTDSGELISWSDFSDMRDNGLVGYGMAGFELSFGEPVTGPLLLGFGSHFGLGVFFPV